MFVLETSKHPYIEVLSSTLMLFICQNAHKLLENPFPGNLGTIT